MRIRTASNYITSEDVQSDSTQFFDISCRVMGNIIPQEYQPVDRIASPGGGPHLTYDFVPNYTKGFKFEMEFMAADTTNRYALTANYSDGSIQASLELHSGKARLWLYSGQIDLRSTNSYLANQKNTLTMSYYDGVATIVLNGVKTTTTKKYSGICSSPNMWIFLDKANRTTTFNHRLDLYSLKAYDGDELKFDLIPCYKKSDNNIGMYDKVNHSFHPNTGSGSLIKGSNLTNIKPMKVRSDVLPSGYQQLQYIENTNNSYISTVNAINRLFVIDMQYTNNNTRQLLGISPSSNAYFGNNKGAWEKIATTGTSYKTTDRVKVYYDVNNITENKTNAWLEGSTTKFVGQDPNFVTVATRPLQLFVLTGTGSYNCAMKLYGMKVYDAEGNLTNNFIPCYQKSDGKTGLYDSIEKEFHPYLRAQFAKGPEII